MEVISTENGTFGGKLTNRNHKDKISEYNEAEDGGDEVDEKQSFQAAEDEPKKKNQRCNVQKRSHELRNENCDMVELEKELDVRVPP